MSNNDGRVDLVIVVDNCILSSLAKISRLDLLEHLSQPVTSPGVIEEIFRSEIETLITTVSAIIGKTIDITPITELQKIPDLQKEHPALSIVDCELILLCIETTSPLLSDDTKLLSIAQEAFKIVTFDLCDLLLALKEQQIIENDEMPALIRALEEKDRYRSTADDIKILKE